ncbi:VRR-NUC domain-containing protein [Clostridium butyricum]|uniref:VRR-NUC domain-containing protein n=1 Tax=Clostridium butyricum TaxID=1492 RepID=UPI00129C10C0|nr:VRR-NUC domain-containing protein [Clostridium butyricum]QGH20210.1 VRR-NUC domain-containing protein [Clostridium butyricum]QGH24245.1 VRR-NUC domain-containing protein [Clostridium butyricum]
MRESKIEKSLKDRVQDMGGIALKFVSPGMAGVPDRIVLIPNGIVVFVELKAPGKTMRPLQLKRKSQLEHLGFSVYLIDSLQGVDSFVKEVFN